MDLSRILLTIIAGTLMLIASRLGDVQSSLGYLTVWQCDGGNQPCHTVIDRQ